MPQHSSLQLRTFKKGREGGEIPGEGGAAKGGGDRQEEEELADDEEDAEGAAAHGTQVGKF